MRIAINHIVGFMVTVLGFLFAGIVGLLIGAAVWAVSIWSIQRAEDRKLMREFMEKQMKEIK